MFNRKRNGTEHLVVSLSGLGAWFRPAVSPKGVKNRNSLSRCSFILQSEVSNSVIMTWTWKELGISEAKRD